LLAGTNNPSAILERENPRFFKASSTPSMRRFMSLLGKVLPMTIADTDKEGETRMVVERRVVWPMDKDGNIIRPAWWEDEKLQTW
jgi:hypothetical protein